MNFADTNFLTALFFQARTDQQARNKTAIQFLRREKFPLAVSPIVLLEARNVFSRSAKKQDPEEWHELEKDGRFYRDPMNWDLLRNEVFALVSRYGHKANLGTFDLAIVASARLAGATRMLSFDGQVAALSLAEGL